MSESIISHFLCDTETPLGSDFETATIYRTLQQSLPASFLSYPDKRSPCLRQWMDAVWGLWGMNVALADPANRRIMVWRLSANLVLERHSQQREKEGRTAVLPSDIRASRRGPEQEPKS